MTDSSLHQRLGFIGGGQMATALAAGALKSELLSEHQLVFAEPNEVAQERLKENFPNAKIVRNGIELLAQAEHVVLAIKPQVLADVCTEIRSKVNNHLFISIVAGYSLEKLQAMLGCSRIVRVMPNTPCQVQAGASGLSAAGGANAEDRAWVERLMSSVGLVTHVSDSLLHAVTGVSGSGPAYAYMMIEALSDGGVAAGLPRATATMLAAQTLLGAAMMVLKTGKHPGELKDQVTSPAGTTIAAVRKLEELGLRSALIEAVLAATNRSVELGSK